MQQPVQITRHPRSRRLKLKVHRDASVEVVAPPRASALEIERFVQSHRAWIEQAQARMRKLRAERAPADEQGDPTRLELRATGHCVAVEYCNKRGRRGWEWREDRLIIEVAANDAANARDLIIGALKYRARATLEERLWAHARRLDLHFGKVSWRHQKTRWASCSSRRNISLNIRLLFLPVELVDYVFVHELAHLDHPNHSPLFWACVERFMPEYRERLKALKRAHQYLPEWLFDCARG
ncbi:MAG: M48 family metallopeptidase [Xanthomonadaceae bacterium]|nr:M48 family metallopeptidase [Xanthomonadaceae bacterium]